MANDVLRVTRGKAAGTTLVVAGTLIIGREGEGIESLGGDAEISRRHAKIVSQPSGGLVIEDLGSSNGTFVNGDPISGPTPLRLGDLIDMGATSIEVGPGSQRTQIAATPDVAGLQKTRIGRTPDLAPPVRQAPAAPVGGPSPAGPSPGGPSPGGPLPGGPLPGGRPSGGRPPGRKGGPPIALLAALVALAIGVGIGAIIWASDSDSDSASDSGTAAAAGTDSNSGDAETFSLMAQGFSFETLDEATGQREVVIDMRTFKGDYGITRLTVHKFLDETMMPPTPTYDAIYTFTTDEGDTLVMRAAGTVTPPEGPDEFYFQTHEDWTVVDGTGPFENARGEGTITTAVFLAARGPRDAPTGSEVVKHIEGTISLSGDESLPGPPPFADKSVGSYTFDDAQTAAKLDEAQRLTGRYLEDDNAIRDGYVPRTENGSQVCSSFGGKGNGAIEYVKSSLIDDTIELGEPEVLLYQPDEPGRRLVGMQYRSTGEGGSVFNQPVSEDKPVTVWAFLYNPAGLFAPGNTESLCPEGAVEEYVTKPGGIPGFQVPTGESPMGGAPPDSAERDAGAGSGPDA